MPEAHDDVLRALGRIEGKLDAQQVTNERHEAALGNLYVTAGELQVFRGRVKATTKAASIAVGLVATLSGIVARAKGWL